MPGEKYLECNDSVLRTVEEGDIAFLQRARNDPYFRKRLRFDEPQNRDQLRSFFESVVVGDDSSVNLIVEVEDAPVGAVNLFDIERRTGEISYWILPEYQQQGLASDAVSSLLDYAFDTRELHRVTARTVDSNEGSRSLLESLGFVLEGTVRENEFIDGRRADTCYYGVLATEWRDDDVR